MKVTDVRMESYRWLPSGPSSSGRYVFCNDGVDFIRVETDEGLTGIGLNWSVGSVHAIGRSIAEHHREAIVGMDPLDTEKIWDRLWNPDLGRRGIATRVISGIDIAMWDIKAKACGMPLYKLLGGYTDRVPAYVSRGFRGQSLKDWTVSLETGVSEGARAIKLQMGDAPINEDVERVRVARDIVGPDIKLMIDASTLYAHHEAIVAAERIEKYDIFWLEEPVKVDDLRGYELVAQATSIPIATGEGEHTKYGFRDLIERRCAAILQPDAMIMGGITEWMKVAAMAQAYHLPMSHHGPHQIHAHLLAAVPNGLIVEEYFTSEDEPIKGGLYKEVLRPVDGYIHPPGQPGLGIELNEEGIAPYRVG